MRLRGLAQHRAEGPAIRARAANVKSCPRWTSKKATKVSRIDRRWCRGSVDHPKSPEMITKPVTSFGRFRLVKSAMERLDRKQKGQTPAGSERENRGKSLNSNGRSERIRTSDPLLPKQVRYQAALRSDTTGVINERWRVRKRIRPADSVGGFGRRIRPAAPTSESGRRIGSTGGFVLMDKPERRE